MQLILMNPEKKKVVIDTTTDPCLYDAPHNLMQVMMRLLPFKANKCPTHWAKFLSHLGKYSNDLAKFASHLRKYPNDSAKRVSHS